MMNMAIERLKDQLQAFNAPKSPVEAVN
jgi:hypothetical protein